MSRDASKYRARFRLGRLVSVYLVVGTVVGCLSGMTERVFAVPHFVVVFFSVGLMVGVAPVINWLVFVGKASWLLRRGDA